MATKTKPTPAAGARPTAATPASKFWVFQEGSELVVMEGEERPEAPESVNGRKVIYLASAPDREQLGMFLARQEKHFGLTVRT